MNKPSDSEIAPQKFTKRPVTIEAMQFDGSVASADAIKAWAIMPNGMSAECGRTSNGDKCKWMSIRTLEGAMTANPGDWIIRGVKGEFYPCKPDIFEQTYTATQPAAARELPEAVALPEDRVQYTLKAMASNYPDGHRWDHLDAETCRRAADEIKQLRAAVAGYRRDAERYRWMRAEHGINSPLAHIVWKERGDRDSAQWVNTGGPEEVDRLIDAALANLGSGDGRECSHCGSDPGATCHLCGRGMTHG